MRIKELINKISQDTSLDVNKTSSIIQSFFDIVYKSLKQGDNISLYNFGKFKLVEKNERRFYNLFTHNIELLPKRKIIKFIPYKQLRESTNKCYLNFDSSQYKHVSSINPQSKNKGINIGTRRTGDTMEYHDNNFRYIGLVDYDYYLGENDHSFFPAVKTPIKGTTILSWYKSHTEAIVGVSEPLFRAEIEKLCDKYEGLSLLDKVALPIRNRQYSYRPDIALYWAKYNIIIDIEIDEPYDICSHKPIHYIGSSDNLRDLYFTRNGWCVIRYSENQVLNHMAEIIQHLEFVINCLANISISNYTYIEEKRWSYDEAAQMAESIQRENSLGLVKHRNYSMLNDKQATDILGNCIKPDKDILPDKVDHFVGLEIYTQLKYTLASNANYIRITHISGLETILKRDSIRKIVENDETIIIGDNPILPYLHEYLIKEITKVEAISSLFTNEHWKYADNIPNKNILVKAASNGSPVWIKYKNSRGFENERIISNPCLFLHDIYAAKPFTDLGTIVNSNNKRFYLFGFCSLREDFRQFACDYRLSEVRIINCMNTFIFANAYQASLAELIMNPYKYRIEFFNRVDYLLSIMPKKEKESLLSLGNIANYETIKGNTRRAAEIYDSIPVDTNMKISEDEINLWGNTVIEDISSFINESKNLQDSKYDYDIVPSKILENFTKVKSMLINQGWSWK